MKPIIQKNPDRVNKKLRESAKKAPHCFGCWMPNHDGNMLCLAHSNRIADGKGRGIKSDDAKGAILCQRCHDYVDGRSGKATREDMQIFHEVAHFRTLAWWKENGYLK